jgi:8-oxo-dGTP pyrophosphatase MutT (NUDIX family)
LAPLVRVDGQTHLLFEVRALHMRRQPGEVCFPGGRIEQGETPLECAVRETTEELGVSRERIRVVGSIGLIYTWLNEPVDVVLGEILDFETGKLETNPDEVHETFTVPFEYFMERAPKDSYTVEKHYIWGLTARFVNYIVKLCREGSK